MPGPVHRPQTNVAYPTHVTIVVTTCSWYCHYNRYREERSSLVRRSPLRNGKSVLSMRSVPMRHILSLYTSTRPKADVPGGTLVPAHQHTAQYCLLSECAIGQGKIWTLSEQ